MTSSLHNLFKDLGYNKGNGLFVLEDDADEILYYFPSRISRILKDIIKPYAIFCVDIQYKNDEHIEPFNNPLILFYDNPTDEQYKLIPKHSFNLSQSPLIIINKGGTIDIYNGLDFSDSSNQWLDAIDIDTQLLKIDVSFP